jgi:hypothetical protein
MTAALRGTVDAVRRASLHAVPTVAASLRPIHSRWMTETMRELASILSSDADFWDGWSAVRYLNDQFDWQYRWQRIFVTAILPLLRPANARVLLATTETLEEVRYDLDRVGRWRDMTVVTRALAYRFVKLLNVWFVEIQRVTQGLSDEGLSSEARRALTQLGPTSPRLRGTRK